MTWPLFLIIFVCCALTILASRTIPLMVLKGRELPEYVTKALGFIPPAAFAALVANDLFTPGMFDAGLFPGVIPLLAAIPVIIVARLTKSLIGSVAIGVAAFAVMWLLL